MTPISREFGNGSVHSTSSHAVRLPKERQAHSADAAQSLLFIEALEAEISELEAAPPDESARVQARLAEVQRLLVGLRRRFPSNGRLLSAI